MKKQLVLSITIVSLLAIIISGSTYAYFSTVVKGNGNDVLADSAEFGVIYNKGNPLTGDIEPTISKDDGLNTSVNIKLSKALSGVTGDILLNVTNISDNLKINGFKWESYKVEGNTETLLKSGNFVNATNGGIISLVDNLPLSTTLTTIKVYIWLDGNDPSVGNEVVDGTASFSGYISAKSNRLTGILDRYTVEFNLDGGTMPNLLYGLENINNSDVGAAIYSINNGVVTVTSKRDDGYFFTNGRIDFEAGKTYRFSAQTDGTWGESSGSDTIQTFLMLDGQYNTYIHMNTSSLNSNGYYDFTPTVSGTYWLRLDVNKNGKTHQFWNISITEKSKQVTYGQSYGTLPTPTRPGYTFLGWNGVQLLENTDTLEGYSFYDTLDNTTTLNGSYSVETRYAWHGIYIDLKQLYDEGKIKIGDTVSLSIYYMMNFIPTRDFDMTLFRAANSSSSGSKMINRATVLPNTWYRVDFPITITDYSITSTKARIETGYYDSNDKYYFGNNRQNYIWFARPQVQLGDTATEYEPYYITSDTTVVQDKNHTLKAIWEPNS